MGSAVDDAVVSEQSLGVGESRAHVLIVARDQELVELRVRAAPRRATLHRGNRWKVGRGAIRVGAPVRGPSRRAWARPAAAFQKRQPLPPIIVLTTDDTEEARVTALERGADECVTKPFSPSELVARIRARLILESTGYRYKAP